MLCRRNNQSHKITHIIDNIVQNIIQVKYILIILHCTRYVELPIGIKLLCFMTEICYWVKQLL